MLGAVCHGVYSTVLQPNVPIVASGMGKFSLTFPPNSSTVDVYGGPS